jgi:hypothetical protein
VFYLFIPYSAEDKRNPVLKETGFLKGARSKGNIYFYQNWPINGILSPSVINEAFAPP